MQYFGFKSDYLIIIDCVPDKDMQTGRRLDEDINDCINKKNTPFYCFLHKCQEYNDFLNTLHKIKIGIVEHNQYPCIHIEGHASKNGLKIGTEITKWEEVIGNLREINILCKNNLFISIAACSSAFLYSHISLTKPAPFFGILAPKEEIKAGVLVNIFSGFYCSLISKKTLLKAKNMVEKNKNGNNLLLIYTYSHFIRECEKYIKYYNRKTKQKKLESILSKLEKIITNISLAEKRKNIRVNQNKDLLCTLDYFYSIFTMTQLYPENRERFIFNSSDLVKNIRKETKI